MTKQTYANYHKAYYEKNKKKILARTKEYRKKYAKEYYARKKAEEAALRERIMGGKNYDLQP